MANVTQTAIASNFDGTANNGLVPLLSSGKDDTQRAMVLSIFVQASADVKTSIAVYIAESLADIAAGKYGELGNLADAEGLNLSCCRCILPRNWNVFIITQGPVLGDVTLFVDWTPVTLRSDI